MAFFIDFSMLFACPLTFIFLEIQAHLKRLFFHYLNAIIAELSLFYIPLITFAICKGIILHGFGSPQSWHNN